MMKRIVFFTFFLSIVLIKPIYAQQNERKFIREGVDLYNDSLYENAEINFRKALDLKPELLEGQYNVAGSLYKQKKYPEAASEYARLLESEKNKGIKADLLHNLGNTYFMNQELDKSIEAYKNALRLRPDDEDTRYNLAYALAMKQQQQQQQQQEQDQKEDEEKEQKEDENKKDGNNQKLDQNKSDEKSSEEQKSKELNQQEVEQMLNAIEELEKETKEKVDLKKAVEKPIRTEKDW